MILFNKLWQNRNWTLENTKEKKKRTFEDELRRCNNNSAKSDVNVFDSCFDTFKSLSDLSTQFNETCEVTEDGQECQVSF